MHVILVDAMTVIEREIIENEYGQTDRVIDRQSTIEKAEVVYGGRG